jgi:nudix motif 8
VHPTNNHNTGIAEDEPLPSIDLEVIRRKTAKDEVDTVFHLPLSAITSPARLRQGMFRGNRPYWPISVSDLVDSSASTVEMPTPSEGGRRDSDAVIDDSEIGGGGLDNKLEVWGLSGWYMTMLMRILRVYT